MLNSSSLYLSEYANSWTYIVFGFTEEAKNLVN